MPREYAVRRSSPLFRMANSMTARLAKIGSFAVRYYVTSVLFAIFGAVCFCAGVYVTQRMAVDAIGQFQAAVKQQALAAAQ